MDKGDVTSAPMMGVLRSCQVPPSLHFFPQYLTVQYPRIDVMSFWTL